MPVLAHAELTVTEATTLSHLLSLGNVKRSSDEREGKKNPFGFKLKFVGVLPREQPLRAPLHAWKMCFLASSFTIFSDIVGENV